ncbi:MAG: hypothetical protein AAF684_03535 [Pseudomonadota bacterium]
MEKLNALLITRLEALHADCVAARPDEQGDAAAACRTALYAVYWGLLAAVGVGDAVIALVAIYFGAGVWSAWGAVAFGCVSALLFYAVSGGVRRRLAAF